jgi:hypothetical protein
LPAPGISGGSHDLGNVRADDLSSPLFQPPQPPAPGRQPAQQPTATQPAATQPAATQPGGTGGLGPIITDDQAPATPPGAQAAVGTGMNLGSSPGIGQLSSTGLGLVSIPSLPSAAGQDPQEPGASGPGSTGMGTITGGSTAITSTTNDAQDGEGDGTVTGAAATTTLTPGTGLSSLDSGASNSPATPAATTPPATTPPAASTPPASSTTTATISAAQAAYLIGTSPLAQ